MLATRWFRMGGAMLPWLMLLAVAPANAEQSVSAGDYTVHYNALRSDLLEPEVARGYGILRSKGRALVTVAVLKQVMGTTGQPVEARVKTTATNLSGQLRTVEMREIESMDASGSKGIYYIGELPVANQETLEFHLEVVPLESQEPISATFSQQFFTD